MISSLEDKGWEMDDPSHLLRIGDDIVIGFSHSDYPFCHLVLEIRLYIHGASVSLQLDSEGDSCIWYDEKIDLDVIMETVWKWSKESN